MPVDSSGGEIGFCGTVLSMRKTSSIAGFTLAAVIALGLTGCVQPVPRVIPTSEPSSKPVFATDAEALAAAKKAYVAYLAVSDAVGNDGGKNAERLAPVVTKEWLPTELKSYVELAKSGEHLTGSSSFTLFRQEQVSQSQQAVVTVVVYVCDDVTASRVINANGKDITPETREDIIPLQVTFANPSEGSTQLLVGGNKPWSGSNFCI